MCDSLGRFLQHYLAHSFAALDTSSVLLYLASFISKRKKCITYLLFHTTINGHLGHFQFVGDYHEEPCFDGLCTSVWVDDFYPPF